jgi:NADH dehydrogenase
VAAARVIIVGGGFGGLACAKALAGSAVQVTLIDRTNYHLFVPLLYQVATAALSPADVARPLRRILSRAANVEVLLGDVQSLDLSTRLVRTRSQAVGPYDYLVLATGSRYSYFGHPDWMRFAKGPRSLEDARGIRSRLLTNFERAEASHDTSERDRLMTVVVVGGGPTGVEMAGSVAELTRHALARDFRHIDPRRARIVLIEAGPRLLAAFPQDLGDYARRKLGDLGVEVLLGRTVESIEEWGVMVGGERLEAGTVIWGAGIEALSVGGWLGVPTDRLGRVAVGPDLSLPGHDDVFVIGDAALCLSTDGRPLPALAQVAKQQGIYVGELIAAKSRGASMKPFKFSNRGDTAIIGRNAAVFDFGRFHLKGRLAWLLWAIVHVYLLVGFENRLSVVMRWAWRYLTYERGARLIMPSTSEKQRDP